VQGEQHLADVGTLVVVDIGTHGVQLAFGVDRRGVGIKLAVLVEHLLGVREQEVQDLLDLVTRFGHELCLPGIAPREPPNRSRAASNSPRRLGRRARLG
jgi:hypothetical protein